MKKGIAFIKTRNNPLMGIIMIISTLIMIFSLLLFSSYWNPFYAIQMVTLIPLIGEMQTLILWLSICMFSILFYLGVSITFMSNKRWLALIVVILSSYWWIDNIIISNELKGDGINFLKYYNVAALDHFKEIFNFGPGLISISNISGTFTNIGFVMPIIFYLLGGWFHGIISGLIFTILILYSIYVLIWGEYQIFTAKLMFWKHEDDNIEINKEEESINLNVETQEFKLNFTPEEKEKLDLIAKVRSNMDTKSYEELTKKILDEKNKLNNLKESIILKIKQTNEESKYKSKLSDTQKNELLSVLGQNFYSKIKSDNEAKIFEESIIKNKNIVTSEKDLTEEKNLIKEGFQTNQEAYDLGEKLLSEEFSNDVINEFYKNYDPTQEIPLLENYYSEIFDNPEKMEEEINKTLESDLDSIEKTGEILIENIESDITVEEYLSIPDEISSIEEKTNEQMINILQEKEEIWEEEDVEETEESTLKIKPLNWCVPYVLPSTSILSSIDNSFDNSLLVEETTIKSRKINEVFKSFKINLELGIRTTKITNLEDNIKLSLGSEHIRIIAPIPGTSFIGIEVPNSIKKPVLFKNVFDETKYKNEGIQISIGQDVFGKPMSFDLTKAPHLLVAGSTGSGKSVAINTILASIIFRYKPTDVQLILVDPKMVEFAPFHDIPHLLAEVITDPTNANLALKAMVDEMENRYKIMAENGVKKLEELNDKLISEGKNKLPYIVIIIDELADLMMVSAKEVEESIMRITQKARAAGIHMIVATQRPSTEIITGTIKSNIPSRMAFTVASSIDSRTILGQIGAEKLIGMGDMLVSLYGKFPIRGQGAYISNEEIEDMTTFVKEQCSAYYTIDLEKFSASLNTIGAGLISITDPMYIAAKDTVIHYQKASTSMLQRHLNIGYNKAANIIETLESEGIVGPQKGSRHREVLKRI